MAWRTRLFAAALRRTATPVEEAQDFAALRGERLKLQGSGAGKLIFGSTDKAAVVEALTLDNGQRALMYRPADAGGQVLPVIINFHGGGWVQGNPEQSAWLASRVAVGAGVCVISPSYRLAPENRYPAGLDDCWDATQWVLKNATELAIDPDRFAVMGDSAGGNLAAVVSLLARDSGGLAIRAQVLIYPGVEMYDKWPSEIRNADAPVLTSANMRAFAKLYLGDQYGTKDFRASPIRAGSHSDLPAAFILTAEHDPLLDNGAKYREKLESAGVAVQYREYVGAIHGFMSLPGVVPVAKDALADIVEYVREAL